jgi:integrase
MKTINDFLDLYAKSSSKSVYRSGLYSFLEFTYGTVRKNKRVTEEEVEQFEALAVRYLSEERDYAEDLMRYAVYLHDKPPYTARTYLNAIREFLAHNGIEFSQRQLKTISGKLPKGNSRTVEKDLDSTTIRQILEHTDIKGKALILTLASSGMRIGELLQVKVSDVDLDSEPAQITIRGEYTKTGSQRVTFISREAREVLVEWLKVRDRYLEIAQHRNNGLVKYGRGRSKSPVDERLFPFSSQVASQIWENALRKAGLLSVDSGTGRKQLRIHQLRKFFRSQLALGCPVDIVEALMGHEGYLTNAYRRYTVKQIGEYYQKGEHLLYISMPKDIQKIESEFKEQLEESRKCIASLMAKNRDLEEKLQELEDSYRLVAEFVEIAKQHPGLVNMLKDNLSKRDAF